MQAKRVANAAYMLQLPLKFDKLQLLADFAGDAAPGRTCVVKI